ncbi:uncharacterized protein VTP21DRAFT_5522 [Calcarisporiella thermophila]|uniref:uncharacterized protein n=1 Tax=Calcarisporiella thermophila TaxID=911321 RepID=UPI0037430777
MMPVSLKSGSIRGGSSRVTSAVFDIGAVLTQNRSNEKCLWTSVREAADVIIRSRCEEPLRFGSYVLHSVTFHPVVIHYFHVVYSSFLGVDGVLWLYDLVFFQPWVMLTG